MYNYDLLVPCQVHVQLQHINANVSRTALDIICSKTGANMFFLLSNLLFKSRQSVLDVLARATAMTHNQVLALLVRVRVRPVQ